jgi:transposase
MLMPWKACSVMEERLRFVARLLEGEAMTDVCREFGKSRKIGYKILNRYKAEGGEALNGRSRRPVRYAMLTTWEQCKTWLNEPIEMIERLSCSDHFQITSWLLWKAKRPFAAPLICTPTKPPSVRGFQI